MKKITESKIRKCISAYKKDHIPITDRIKTSDGSEVCFEITPYLDVAQKRYFIERVLSGCFDNSGAYLPEYLEPMFRATVLQMCTNLPTLSIKADEEYMDLDSMYILYEITLSKCEIEGFNKFVREMWGLVYEVLEEKKIGLDPGFKKFADQLAYLVDQVGESSLLKRDLTQNNSGVPIE